MSTHLTDRLSSRNSWKANIKQKLNLQARQAKIYRQSQEAQVKGHDTKRTQKNKIWD